jgi:hypothetical protein
MDAYDAFVNKTKEPEIPAVPGEGKNLTGGTGELSNLGDLRKSEYEYSSTSTTPTTSKEFQWVVEDAYENAYQPLLVKYKGIDGYYKADDIKLTDKNNLSTVEALPKEKINLKDKMTINAADRTWWLGASVAQYNNQGDWTGKTLKLNHPPSSFSIDGYKKVGDNEYIYHLTSPLSSAYGETYYLNL